MIKVLIFDFDGVLVDSNETKYKAFFDIFSSIPSSFEVVKEVLDNYREKSRFFIIQKILRKLKIQKKIKFSCLEDMVLFYAKKYNNIVEKAVIRSKEMPYAKMIIKKLYKKYNLYIFSTTPRVSLVRILKRRGIENFFKKIYGWPKTKSDSFQEIINREKVLPNETIIIGDGYNDLEVAKKFGANFVGIANKFNNFKNCDFPVLKNLKFLPNIIKEYNIKL